MLPAVATLISGALNLLGNIGTNVFSALTGKSDNEFNAKEAQKQRNFEEQMYQLYESPQAQSNQRLSAGLNPVEGVSSSSVGSGSTASAASKHSMIMPNFDFIQQLPFMQYEIENRRLQNDKMELENEALRQENAQRAIENHNYTEWYPLWLESMKHDRDFKKASKEEREAMAQKAWHDAIQFQEFHESGGNIYSDAHDELVQRIKESQSRTDLTDTQQRMLSHTLSLAQKFDEKFMQLDYDMRVQEVKEYLEQIDIRKDLVEWHHEIAEYTKDTAKREAGLHSLQFQYESAIWTTIIDLLEDEKTSKKAVAILAGYIAKDPTGALNALGSIIPDYKPTYRTSNTHYHMRP